MMEDLSTIDDMKSKIESLEDHVDAGITEAANNIVVTTRSVVLCYSASFDGLRH